MQLFYGHIEGATFQLQESDAVHCSKVLRKQIGDTIHFITGDGSLYRGTISLVTKKSVEGSFALAEENFGEIPYELTVAIAPTKNMDRLEWFLEKSIEMGITKVVPILCDHSERKVVKPGRLEKIALSATKQSLKGSLVELAGLTKFSDFIATVDPATTCIAHCEPQEKQSFKKAIEEKGNNLTILIGPEGDFSKREIQQALAAGLTPVHLGKSRLRTETAALVAVSMMYQHAL